MTLWECLRSSIRALRANMLRSALTILGIVIGVAAVVAMVAIGRGAQTRVEDQIRSLGSNLLLVQSGASRRGGVRLGAGSGHGLTEDDANAIANDLADVVASAPTIAGPAHLVRGNLNWSSLVGGVTPDYLIARDWSVADGRAFTNDELRMAAKVVLLGTTVVRKLFPDQAPLGETVRIANVPFTVIGVLDEKGQASASGRDQDDVVLMPLTSAKLRVLGSSNPMSRQTVDFIMVKAASTETIGPLQRQIELLLRQRHRLPADAESDFELSNPAAAMEAQAAATRSLTLFLAAVASISLVVGGISIMNIMLVSVTERTREIGLRQALGARRRDIRNQFLVEAIVLCLLGGLAGVALGIGAAVLTSRMLGWPVLISPMAAVIAVTFAAAVGIFFGFYPARKASRLHPIEALRFE